MHPHFQDPLIVPDISLPKRTTGRGIAVAVISTLYGISFFPNALDGMPGYVLFLYGAFFSVTIIGLYVSFAWLANPLLWAGLIAFAQGRFARARNYGLAATAFALSFLVAPYATPGNGGLRIGYWLWLGSIACLPIAAVIFEFRVLSTNVLQWREPKTLDLESHFGDRLRNVSMDERIRNP